MSEITVEKLNKAGFAAFGDVVETRGANNFLINQGSTVRFHDLADIEFLGISAKPIISIFRGNPHPLPIRIEMMERHPQGSQMFFPLQPMHYLVVVAPDLDGVPGEPKAFLASGNQGVNYHANIWHHPLLSLQKISDFLIVDRDGEGNNLEEYFYGEPYLIDRI